MQLELNLKKNPFIFTSLVLLAVAFVFFAALTLFQSVSENDRVEKNIINLNKGWEYKWDDEVNGNSTVIDFDKIAEGDWSNYTITGKPLINDGNHKAVWFRVNLPRNDVWGKPAIYFELMLSKIVEAYIDNRLIYRNSTYVLPGATSYVVSRDRLLVPLESEFAGKMMYIKVHSDMEAVGPYRNVYYGQNQEVIRQFMRQDMGSVILGFFFIVFGIFVIPNIIFVNKRDRKSLIFLSSFIVSLGLVFISISVNMNILFIQNSFIYMLINSIACIAAIMSFMAFFRQVFFIENTSKLLKRLWNINILLYFLVLIASVWSYIGGPIPYNLVGNFFALLVVIDLTVQIVLVIRIALKGNIDARIFTVGFVSYTGISIAELPLFYIIGRVPSMYKWGILIFVAALILILGRRFSDAHDKLVIYSNELVSNNEKLNNALTELQISKNEVDELNKTLEQKVIERTQELKKAMDNLVRTQDQLIQSEKMAALGSLVVGVAHEINTPVGVGVTAASHLEVETKEIVELYRNSKMKRSDFDEYLNMCVQSTGIILTNLKRAADLIRSFKKVATDQSSEEKRKFRVGDYINEILLSLTPELRRASHNVEVNCSDDIELDGFPGAFSQVITNLVMNTIIHAYNEGESGIIRFNIESSGDRIILRYSDNGKGIKKELLTRIFDPFVTTKRNNGGTGLGLNIVYNIITQTFKGNIQCDSEEGKGTSFIISFPVNKPV